MSKASKETEKNAPQYRMDEVVDILRTAMLVPMSNPASKTCVWGLPSLLEGGAGIGKSSTIRRMGDEFGIPVETIAMGTKQPDDFGLIPVVLNGALHYEAMMPAITRIIQDRVGILFLDEITSTTRAVFNVSMSLVLDREYSGMKIPGDIRILAACNPPEISGGLSLPMPLANRFAHFHVIPSSVKSWTDYISNVNESAASSLIETQTNKIVSSWPSKYNAAATLVSAYMQATPQSLYVEPTPGTYAYSHAWPSPRTWEFATRAMATCDILKKTDNPFIEACLGSGAASAFISWRKTLDLPKPLDVLTTGWMPPIRRLDIAYLVLNSTIHWLSEQSAAALKSHKADIWKLMARYKQAGMLDLVASVAKKVFEIAPVTKNATSPEDKDVLEAAQPVLLDLGRSGFSQFFT